MCLQDNCGTRKSETPSNSERRNQCGEKGFFTRKDSVRRDNTSPRSRLTGRSGKRPGTLAASPLGKSGGENRVIRGNSGQFRNQTIYVPLYERWEAKIDGKLRAGKSTGWADARRLQSDSPLESGVSPREREGEKGKGIVPIKKQGKLGHADG